ncbi:MAG: protein kinase [Planctomycetes bacterium]|nr:protein kinase [Planctomycetota bacterium]
MALPTPLPIESQRPVRVAVPKVLGGFELLELIGKGAMGRVYRARQTAMDRIVALKVLSPGVAEDKLFAERFQREARASARLNHPNIVQGIDVGRDADSGYWYFAMEYVGGPSLSAVLHEFGKFSERRALELARGIARALACAGKKGIVHRDVKPDNVLLSEDGEPKLADLGLARQISEDARLTQSGMAVGTPHYMAPEQVLGETAKIDARTDLYALGATLFHLVTGRTVFQNPVASAVMTMHATERPPLANDIEPEVSEGCARLIDRLLAKKREDRYQSAEEVLDAIENLLRPAPTATVRTLPRRIKSPGRLKRRRIAPSLGITAAAPRPGTPPRGTPVRKPTGKTPARGLAPVSGPVRVPLRAAPRPVEVAPQRPSQLKGLFVDLVVTLGVLLVLVGGLYWAKSEGHLPWLALPDLPQMPWQETGE